MAIIPQSPSLAEKKRLPNHISLPLPGQLHVTTNYTHYRYTCSSLPSFYCMHLLHLSFFVFIVIVFFFFFFIFFVSLPHACSTHVCGADVPTYSFASGASLVCCLIACRRSLCPMAGPRAPQHAAGWLAVAADHIRDSGFGVDVLSSTSSKLWPYMLPFALYFKPLVVLTALTWYAPSPPPSLPTPIPTTTTTTNFHAVLMCPLPRPAG